ncbi:transport permease protein [Thermopolyspora flexuosa]|jgi:ABC-2 type transport system permease protein|uniref:Transport permease protein n=1 Tax=Thermopolyspora flexuosa TaxID=103836 RepID=A0A543J1C6_9ACTN|nr:ABC transporter permease [Thermopolyspora flexuosa]TQM76623.1 ABC-2 type transport system permease protein [Thermopolyspora flexuosa]GGM85541.1 transport permease protein [Thermopolyspora flexuosa]
MSKTTTLPVPAAATAAARLPATLRVGWSRAVLETRMFFRERDSLIFTFSFPVVLLVLFGSIFRGEFEDSGVSVSQLYAAGLIGAGLMSVSFQNLAIAIAVEREDGTLKRLAGTPMPPAAYFVGKVLSVLLAAVLEVALLLAVGVLLYDLEPPADAARWATFAWVFVLGLAACSLLGIAFSSLPRSAKSASAVVTLPFVALQFVSGVFIPFAELPQWVTHLASLFPLRWMCQGFRSVFLGDAGAALELTGSYELDRVALILAAWTVGGLLLCLKTFRWTSRREG